MHPLLNIDLNMFLPTCAWGGAYQGRQFPVKLAWAMTINKAQGQSLDRVEVMWVAAVFAHGQLYVALSRGRACLAVRVWVQDTDKHGYFAGDGDTEEGVYTDNVVYKDILLGIPPPGGSPATADAVSGSSVLPPDPQALCRKAVPLDAAIDLADPTDQVKLITTSLPVDASTDFLVPGLQIDLARDNAEGQTEYELGGKFLDLAAAVSLQETCGLLPDAIPGSDVGTSRAARVPILSRPWRAPRQSLTPLPFFLGSSVADPPEWYNDPESGATSPAGTQIGATCGLLAVNHILTAALLTCQTPIRLLRRSSFEDMALNAGIADHPAHLVQPGGANYDISVLNYHLGLQGLRSHPMTPAALQGTVPGESRLEQPFQNLLVAGSRFRSVGYVVRTPQVGGHWIALLPPIVLGLPSDSAIAGVLCDSLEAVPFQLNSHEVEELPPSSQYPLSNLNRKCQARMMNLSNSVLIPMWNCY